MPDHTCKDCRFWESGDRWGECKRRAPANVTDQIWGQWPKTSADNWCGDLELKPGHPHESLEAYMKRVQQRVREDRNPKQ